MKDILRQRTTHWELLTMNYVLLTIDCKLRIIDYELRTKLFQAKQIKKAKKICGPQEPATKHVQQNPFFLNISTEFQ